jgi:hypothetical protein
MIECRLSNSLDSARGLVGVGRFERPTPCAQGSLAASMGSIVFRLFLIFTTVRGICFRSKSNSGGFNRSSSNTVLAQMKSRGSTEAPVVYQSNQVPN